MFGDFKKRSFVSHVAGYVWQFVWFSSLLVSCLMCGWGRGRSSMVMASWEAFYYELMFLF